MTVLKMKSKYIAVSIIVLLFVLNISGCTPANRKRGWKKTTAETAKYEPGRGDAFLFDVKIYRDKRKNSVRLDVYRAGDTLAVFARGYLGKGVLKGLITHDSVLIYFPTEKEYYSGRLSDLVGDNCRELPLEFLLVKLFEKRPVELETKFPRFYITVLDEEGPEQKYRIVAKGCAENIEISYDYKKNRFVPENIDYTNEDGSFRFRAKRRKVRLDISIPAEKFSLEIPPTAQRILR